jgi:hypothetical protein
MSRFKEPRTQTLITLLRRGWMDLAGRRLFASDAASRTPPGPGHAAINSRRRAETREDQRQFEIFKVTLSTRIWATPLHGNFSVELMEYALAPGELPAEALRADYWNDLKAKQLAV